MAALRPFQTHSSSVNERPSIGCTPSTSKKFWEIGTPLSRCGSPLPDPEGTSDWLEIPAGLLDDDPGLRPDKHIFVEMKAAWEAITDSLPQLDKAALGRLRAGAGSP